MLVFWSALLVQGCFLIPERANRAPVFAPIADLTLEIGEPLRLTLEVEDRDNDPLTFTLGQGPEGASLTGDQLIWTPTEADVGLSLFAIEVSDNQEPPLTDAISFGVTVAEPPPPPPPNRPPVALAVDPQSVAVDQTVSFTLSATDPDGDELTWSTAALPANATLTPGGAFSFTPNQDQEGGLDLVFIVSDGAEPPLTDEVSVQIVVTAGVPFDLDLTAVFALRGGERVDEGYCVDLLDIAPELAGQPPMVLASTRVGVDGAVAFRDVTARPALGFGVLVDDCDLGNLAPLPAITLLPPDAYASVGEGEVVTDRVYALLSSELADIDVSGLVAGWPDELAGGGFVLGFASSSTTPPTKEIGVTVSCASCADPQVFYADTNFPKEGYFRENALLNTQTSRAGWFVVPDAELGVYSLAGDLTWNDLTLGGVPRAAVVLTWRGQ